MQRYIMAATLLLALGLGLVVDRTTSAQDSFSCDDFSTFDEALSAFSGAGGPQSDPNGVDPDRDGFPCEDLDGTPGDAQSAATNAFPQAGGTFVGSGAASNSAEESSATIDGSFIGSAVQSDDEDGDESTGIGPLVGSAAQSDDESESTGLGSDVGSEGAWSDGSETGETVASMPSTGVGSVEFVPSMLTMSLMALCSALALGAGTLSLVRVGRR